MIGPTIRTVRHLRPSQIAHRLWRRACRPAFGSSLYLRGRDTAVPDAFPGTLFPGDAAKGQAILNGRISLIGLQRAFEVPFDWNAAEMPLLWRFTLHYFDWLDDVAATADPEASGFARVAVADWIERHRRVTEPAWHPYPLSLRLCAWLRNGPFLLSGAVPEFKAEFATALARQARHLVRVVEHDVAGNHVVKNLKALIVAGTCLPERQTAGRRALNLLESEISRQILSDGCHYERSPSYHFQVLVDLVEIREVLGNGAPTWLVDAIERMAPALAFFRHGDGALALFNDGETGNPATIEHTLALTPFDGATPDDLPSAGYARLIGGGTSVLFDAGRCCPDDLPAHAHADTLAFELSCGTERLVVNSGTFAYQDSRWRNRLRGTAAHSTVSIDDVDSAEVYGVFRLGRRPRVVGLKRWNTESETIVEGVHDGYRHIGLSHVRRIALALDGSCLSGTDTLTGSGYAGRTARAHFHLHPDIDAEQAEGTIRLRTPEGVQWRFSCDNATAELESGVYAPRFYTMTETRQIVATRPLDKATTALSWRFIRE